MDCRFERGEPSEDRTRDHLIKSCMPYRILASETVQRQITTNNGLDSVFYARSKKRDHFGDHNISFILS